jgi:hypothetical protein
MIPVDQFVAWVAGGFLAGSALTLLLMKLKPPAWFGGGE